MIIFILIIAGMGFTFLRFGYLIYIKKKQNLINDFKEEFTQGLKTIEYANKVGRVYLVIGSLLILLSFVLLLLELLV